MTCSKTSFLMVCTISLAACDLGLPDDGGAEDDDDGAADSDTDEEGGEEASDPTDAESDESDGANDESEGSVDETGDLGDPGEPIPPALLGAWVIPGSTAGAAIAFADDRSYARVNVGEATIGSCTTRIEVLSAGLFVVEGDAIELQPTEARKTKDECGTVTESDELPAPETLAWQIGQDEWGEALVLTDATGYAATYHRE